MFQAQACHDTEVVGKSKQGESMSTTTTPEATIVHPAWCDPAECGEKGMRPLHTPGGVQQVSVITEGGTPARAPHDHHDWCDTAECILGNDGDATMHSGAPTS